MPLNINPPITATQRNHFPQQTHPFLVPSQIAFSYQFPRIASRPVISIFQHHKLSFGSMPPKNTRPCIGKHSSEALVRAVLYRISVNAKKRHLSSCVPNKYYITQYYYNPTRASLCFTSIIPTYQFLWTIINTAFVHTVQTDAVSFSNVLHEWLLVFIHLAVSAKRTLITNSLREHSYLFDIAAKPVSQTIKIAFYHTLRALCTFSTM